jgi:uncharacterized integral membrane protein (TIGR00698 family)
MTSPSTLPGLAVAAAAAGAAMLAGAAVPAASPVLLAIAAGAAARNLGWLPGVFDAGLELASRRILRIGIVLLGLQLSLQDIGALGWGVPALALTVVAIGIAATLLLGRLLGVARKQSLLIACGFSICGAAAVAGVERAVDADDDDTVTAVALVVVFGTLMIPLLPWLSGLLGLPGGTAGIWAGASIHEVAQVAAAGGILGGGALALAVTVKLARVLMLAPVAAVLSWQLRRSSTVSSGDGATSRRPPLVPLFVLGFVLMVAARSYVPVPAQAIDAAVLIQRALLTMAMFGLGCGVRIGPLFRRGLRPAVLAAGSTAVVGLTGLAGAVLIT